MSSVQELDRRIRAIEKRNASVELDKAWETSVFRKVILMVCTYVSIGLYMSVIAIEHPWINAVIPTVGFFLSTLTMPIFKRIWTSTWYRR